MKRWFDVVDCWSQPITQQNRVLRPDALWDDGAKRVFYVENQGVWLAAIGQSNASDPAVLVRENVESARWERTGFRLSEFLLRAAAFEAVMGSTHGACASWVTPEQLADILAPTQEVPHAAWPTSTWGHRFYVGAGLLAYAGPNPGPGETAQTAVMRDVWVAARAVVSLDYLRRLRGIEWDYLA